MILLRVAAPLLYVIAAVFAGRYFVLRFRAAGVMATRMFLLAWIVHTVLVLRLWAFHGHLPVASWADALNLWMWMLAALYLLFEWRLRERSLGVVFMTLVALGQILACLACSEVHHEIPLLRSVTVQTHVFIALVSYTGFTMSFVSGLLLLFLLRELKQKQLKFFFSRLPALEFLDRLSAQSALVGLVFLTLGIGLGLFMGPSLGVARWYLDPKFLSVFITWLIYAVGLFGRMRLGWWGGRYARITVGGFVWIWFSFAIVGKFLSDVHSF